MPDKDILATNDLVWLDLEMTGLDPNCDQILEAAILVTDPNLKVLAIGPELVIHQPDEVLSHMNAWCQEHHGKSGLTQRVCDSTLTIDAAETQLFEFVRPFGPKGSLVLAGNSIHQDRNFVRRFWPKLDAYLHYRLIDVSTVKELVRRWYPESFAKRPEKRGSHRALDDIHESLAELRYYRNAAFADQRRAVKGKG